MKIINFSQANNTWQTRSKLDLLRPVRQWLDDLEVRDAKVAQLLCRLIPGQCPFERDIKLFGSKFHLPPLCKLNPLYEQLAGLRFRAMCYLEQEGLHLTSSHG